MAHADEPGNARCKDPREIPLFARNDGWVVGRTYGGWEMGSDVAAIPPLRAA
jgi:hypothetical protein